MEEFRSGYILEVNSKDRQKALETFGEYPELEDGNLTSLRSWFQEQTHLKGRQDDEFLLMFLRETKFSQKQARELLEKYIRNRCSDPQKELHLKGPELDREVSEIILAAGVFVLPTLPESGRRTMFCIHGNIDGKKHTSAGVVRASILSLEVAKLDQVTQIYGNQLILDTAGMNFSLMRTMTPAIIRASAKSFVNEMPLKTEAMHFFHCPLVVRGSIALFKLAMSSKSATSISDHGNDTAHLQKQLQPEVLPEEYGGKAGSCLELANRWHQHVCSNLHRLGTFDVVSNDGDQNNKSQSKEKD